MLESVLSLGDHYISDFIEPGSPDGLKAPLELVLCPRCHLLQLKDTVPSDQLYRNYWYRSGTNRTMREALADISSKAERLIHLRPGDSVLDIGCNDGTLLASYTLAGLYRIGFDPAENLAPASRRVADTVVSNFFGAETYFNEPTTRERAPKVVTSIAMFYDLEDPNRFVSDVKAVMDRNGLWIVQMSYLPLMLKQNAFDNICHEHLEYYSLQSLEYLLNMHDLKVVDIETNDVNGGSVRVYIRNANADDTFADATYRELGLQRVRAMREQELKQGLEGPEACGEFAWRVQRVRDDVVGFIRDQTTAGRTVYAYGASTKGNTLLQYFDLDSTVVGAAAERNPDKWGKVTVGTHVPIVSEDEARSAKPDYFLVLPWHFIEEFVDRERNYLTSGGRFILPMPHFTLI